MTHTPMHTSAEPAAAIRGPVRIALIGGLVGLELLIISLLYQHNYDFECRALTSTFFCAFAGRAVLRAIAVAAGLALIVAARPVAFAPLLTAAGQGGWRALPVQLAGFVLILAPWLFLRDGAGPVTLALGLGAWIGGLTLTGLGLMRLIAPWTVWREVLARVGWSLAIVLAVALALPELADQIQPLWKIEAVTRITFDAVLGALALLGFLPLSDLSDYAIRVGAFGVRVGPQCSGVEGFALISVFLTGYMALFWRDLRFPHVLVLLPIGIALSWCLNVVRITALIWIGAEVDPELAINGFHSHAGWLLFSILSLSLIAVSRRIGWFRRGGVGAVTAPAAAPVPPLAQDWTAARILPFIIFMASALTASTFSETPAILYPARALAMAAALGLFWRLYAGMGWRPDPAALGTGAVIGLLWVATAAPAEPGALDLVLAGLGAGAFAVWVAARVLGTVVLVPLIEELFFRSYLLERLGAGRGLAWTLLAVALSTAAFAGLHGRWLAAGLAGLVFAWLALRKEGRVSDAVVSHALANGIIAAWAVWQGDWAVI
ncbi:MAG: exosortase E/protease, VPEID-CTERM system [Pseudomonadota bacterium]